MNEKLQKRITGINNKFEEMGFSIYDDLVDLVEMDENVAHQIENTKVKKMGFFSDENSVGFTLSDLQVEFTITTGEDEEGPWYETTAFVRYF